MFFYILQLKIYLTAEVSHAVLNDLKIFIREDPSSTEQTGYTNAPGEAWIVREYESDKDEYEFDIVRKHPLCINHFSVSVKLAQGKHFFKIILFASFMINVIQHKLVIFTKCFSG